MLNELTIEVIYIGDEMRQRIVPESPTAGNTHSVLS
jgi:hypothetical protein